MSADGSTFIVGAPYSDGSGLVRVYKFDSTIKEYVVVGFDIRGEATGDNFGFSVGISANGTTIVVGAQYNDGNGQYSGQVRVYKFDTRNSSYIQVGSDINGEAANDSFGASVSISADGDTFVAGATKSNNDSGHARVFRFNTTTNTYTQVGPNINGETTSDFSGSSVAISADGTTIGVGAQFNRDNGDQSGHIRVYNFDTTAGRYVQKGSDIDGTAQFDNFGASVELSADGSTLIGSARGYDLFNSLYSGHVRVYNFNTTFNNYVQVGSDISGETPNDYFGRSIGLSSDGTTLVVGMGEPNKFGRVRIYRIATLTVVPTQTPTVAPTQIPTQAPTTTPTFAPSSTRCGLFRLNVFCPRRGKCGFLRRLFRIGHCQ